MKKNTDSWHNRKKTAPVEIASPAPQSLGSISEFIPLTDCKDRWLYRINSRNLTLGVFQKERKGFVGIRRKFDNEFLFVEFHWDTGEPFGTVKPLQRLERCPIRNLDEYVRSENGELSDNKYLFAWLRKKEA